MGKLTDSEIIGLIREEYQKKVREVVDELDSFIKLGASGDVNILSPGLKIRDRDAGLLYTIDLVRPDGCQVVSAVGVEFFIKNDELRDRYILD